MSDATPEALRPRFWETYPLDESAARVRQVMDDYITRAGIIAPAPEPDPAETVEPHLPDPPITRLDAASIGTVIWCTGFTGSYGWVTVPGALDDTQRPIHDAGVSPVAGLYFAGLDFAVSRRSGILLGVEEEAFRFADLIAARPS